MVILIVQFDKSVVLILAGFIFREDEEMGGENSNFS
jgi:hypothetical protein